MLTLMKPLLVGSLVLCASACNTVGGSNVKTASANALTEQQAKTLVVGSTLKGRHAKKGFDFAMYVDADGTLKEDRSGSIFSGKWHFDKEGRFCWSYNHKDKTWCRWISDNGDNSYSKSRDNGAVVRRFEIIPGKAF